MDFKNPTNDLTPLRVLLPVSKLLHCYCSKTKHFCCCFSEWIQIVNIIYIMRFILKKIKEKEDRKTFSGKKKALFSLTKGTNKLCYGFLAKWKDTMFLKIRLSYKVRQNISHSQSTKFYVYGSYKIFLLKKSLYVYLVPWNTDKGHMVSIFGPSIRF